MKQKDICKLHRITGETMPNEIRIRVREPQCFTWFRYIVFSAEMGLRAIIGLYLYSGKTAVQSLRFSRSSGWNMRSARKWAASHWDML